MIKVTPESSLNENRGHNLQGNGQVRQIKSYEDTAGGD